MKLVIRISAVFALLYPMVRVAAPDSASAALVVRIGPEMRLNPTRVTLHFRISGDGSGDLASQTEMIGALARVQANQQIRLTARRTPLSGPAGLLPGEALKWQGTPASATWGGKTATCTSGSLTGASEQDLVSDWQKSGSLTCAVTFALPEPRHLPPGVYTSIVELDLRAE